MHRTACDQQERQRVTNRRSVRNVSNQRGDVLNLWRRKQVEEPRKLRSNVLAHTAHLCKRHTRAERGTTARHLGFIELGYKMQTQKRRWHGLAFVDLHAKVSSRADDPESRMERRKGDCLAQRCWREQFHTIMMHSHRLLGCRDRFSHCKHIRISKRHGMLLGGAHGKCRLNDRRVSSASAQVASEIVHCSPLVGLRMFLQHTAQRHHETRCAIAALRCMTGAHGVLRWR